MSDGDADRILKELQDEGLVDAETIRAKSAVLAQARAYEDSARRDMEKDIAGILKQHGVSGEEVAEANNGQRDYATRDDFISAVARTAAEKPVKELQKLVAKGPPANDQREIMKWHDRVNELRRKVFTE